MFQLFQRPTCPLLRDSSDFEGKTSGLKNLQLDAAFAAIPIDDVSESTQNKIVAVLQGLEKKIALNRQINQNLPILGRSSEVVEIRRVA